MGKIILLDGAFGTSLWEKAAARGIEKVPTWHYNIEHPELIDELVKEYAQAGADYIQANTFSANRFAMKGAKYSVSDIVKEGVQVTKSALAGTGKKTVLSVGPLPVLMEPYGDLEEDEAIEIYNEIFEAAMPCGPDIITLETFMDLGMISVAAREAVKYGVPVLATMTFEKRCRTMMGNKIEDIVEELADAGVTAVGMNCSLGPEEAVPVIEEFAKNTDMPLIFKPNAGMPVIKEDGTEEKLFSARAFAESVAPVLPLVSYVGGCCGTDPSFIE